MRTRTLTVLGLALVFVLASTSSAMAFSGLATKALCGLDSCHSHPGFTDFSTWHTSHQSAPLSIPCEGCHPNNHTQGGPPSAPDATYSLAESCNPCHMASTATAPAHTAAGVTSCVGCHPAVGALSGTVSGSGSPLVGVSVTVAGKPAVFTYADGSYFVSGVPQGTYAVTYAKAGYTSETIAGISIMNGGVTNQNVTLVDTTAASTFTFTASASANGTISPFGTQVVSAGSNLTVIITPNSGYHVADVLVDGVSVGAVTSYTFTNVAANHTIAATFTANFAATMMVNSANFSNPIAYSLLSLQSTHMVANINQSAVHAMIVVNTTVGNWTIFNANIANTAGANFTFPNWNGKNPVTGASVPFAATYKWTLTVTKNGQTATRTGTLIISNSYAKFTGSLGANATRNHIAYMIGSAASPKSVNIYVSATAASAGRLAIRVTGPGGYNRVPTGSPWLIGPGAPVPPTGRLTGAAAIRANGNYNFNVTGTTNVSYTISVIE